MRSPNSTPAARIPFARRWRSSSRQKWSRRAPPRRRCAERLSFVQDEIIRILYAAGISIGIDDMVVPSNKKDLVGKAEKDVMEVQSQYLEGAITHGERYNKII